MNNLLYIQDVRGVRMTYVRTYVRSFVHTYICVFVYVLALAAVHWTSYIKVISEWITVLIEIGKLA